MTQTASRFTLHQLIHWGAVGIMVPVMTLVLRRIGLSLLEVGFALAAYSLTTVLLEVPSGALSDLWGRRRTYSLGTICDLASVGLLVYAPSVGVVVVASALRGVGRAFASGSLDALAIEALRRESPDYDLQLFFSTVGMAIPAGLAVTSFLGGFLPELSSVPGFRSISGWSPAGPFSVNLVVHGVLVALAGALAWVLFSEERPVARHHHTTGPRPGLVRQIADSVSFGVRSKRLAMLLFSSVAAGLVLLSVETFWQPRLNQIMTAETVRVFGILSSAYFAVAVVGSAVSPLVVRLLGGNRAVGLIAFRVLSALVLGVLAAQTGTAGFSVAYLAFFLLYAAGNPAHEAMLNELVPDERRSTLISVNSLMVQVGGFGGSLLFGVLSERFGIPVSWTVAAVGFALSAAFFVPLVRGEHGRLAGLQSRRRYN